MDKEELKGKLRILCSKERNIFDLCTELKLNEYEILSLVGDLISEGMNITTKVYDDDLYLFDQGERETIKEFNYHLPTDENNEFKFVAILILDLVPNHNNYQY